jgi:hypothetical protein
MEDGLGRIVVGLPVAALWPLTVPYLSANRVRAITAAALSSAYILAPRFPEGASWLLLLATPALTLALAAILGPSDSTVERKRPDGARTLWAFTGALGLALGTVALLGFDEAVDALGRAIDADCVALVATGAVACVFIGGAVVAWLLAPFAGTLRKREETDDLPSLRYAGRYIGWLERAILFALVLGGSPEAAALALAAKSFARFPSLQEHHEGFAEYFLIGSLASITVALATAVATRAAIGATPVL